MGYNLTGSQGRSCFEQHIAPGPVFGQLNCSHFGLRCIKICPAGTIDNPGGYTRIQN